MFINISGSPTNIKPPVSPNGKKNAELKNQISTLQESLDSQIKQYDIIKNKLKINESDNEILENKNLIDKNLKKNEIKKLIEEYDDIKMDLDKVSILSVRVVSFFFIHGDVPPPTHIFIYYKYICTYIYIRIYLHS
jgi:hypothetical protein